ncbi:MULTISPECIES: cytochrome c oxidase, cbb3-type, CcoQ subunit [unclassified Nitratiruptor]|uniref:cytochrome c oxidase, cbb3-type, CcoQ subunit n=1 Tax=unclassified Nitratiruptor TaxID=2624044 RepID=UPI001915D1A8|nr:MULTISPECIES: cytochrome c oxidase, cbb3-type, CcoQ subunit [unclassified Nitratiruptor]BCD60915.1 cytochrome c oxidase cbb3-type subunit IV [Nitratiruptor sp. YY08-10]BCD64847.1 cytochrome c oxidase cbb3-type subunit IV [Nitratiruptor sp. YY08-14]
MDARLIQGVLYLALIIFLTFVLYGYIVHLYRSEKKGERDYEKYGKMALDDELTSKPVEPIEEENKKESQ